MSESPVLAAEPAALVSPSCAAAPEPPEPPARLSAPKASACDVALASPSRLAAPQRTFRSITREQFLLREMRIVARLRLAGTPDGEIRRLASEDNVFQYPTTQMTGGLARVCLMRLDALGAAAPGLTELIAEGTQSQAAQACLYAMARSCAIVWEFLVRVVGWHYATLDYSLTARDVNVFLHDMASEEPAVAAWSDATLVKTRQVLRSALVAAGQLAGPGSDELVPIYLDPQVERGIRLNGDIQILPAYNCMEVA